MSTIFPSLCPVGSCVLVSVILKKYSAARSNLSDGKTGKFVYKYNLLNDDVSAELSRECVATLFTISACTAFDPGLRFTLYICVIGGKFFCGEV